MNNTEKLKNFIIDHLGERLICYYPSYKRDYSPSGRMYFPQDVVEKKGEKHYKTFNGFRKVSDVLDLIKNYKSTEKIEKIDMTPVGKFLGSTRCRCCDQNLGNGFGDAVFVDNGDKLYNSLTGGSDHYISHGINLNLISCFFENKEKNMKAHIIFVGEIKDIKKINEYISSLDMFIKNNPKMKIRWFTR